MALPAFFSRVADSLRPVAEVDPDTLERKLSAALVQIRLRSADPNATVAYDLAANLCARLYPRIELVAEPDVAARAAAIISGINPAAEVTTVANERRSATGVGRGPLARMDVGSLPPASPDGTHEEPPRTVVVDAYGWNVLVDPAPADVGTVEGHPLAWLAAAAVGASELFRMVFADELGDRGRTQAQRGGFNLIDGTVQPPVADKHFGTEWTRNPQPPPTSPLDLGDFHLVGAGAIGQAAVYALRNGTNANGRLIVVDPETVTMSNLQRYLLTDAESVGQNKSLLIRQSLADSGITVEPHSGRWGDQRDHLEADTVLVALDTAEDRLTVAGTLPTNTYNAWTQVADLGWSRHENFGNAPCLACLYYPDRVTPSEHELIGEALNQPSLRVLAYLTYNIPIGFPLPGIPALADLTPEPGDERWLHTALIHDLVAAGMVNEEEVGAWSDKTIGTLYRDGICAGGLLPVGDLPGDVLVPLAHQSALAGIMLAVELVAARDPQLAPVRDIAKEHRYDVLRGFPQILARPRERTPGCICSDPLYQEVAARRG